jgi:uncharacterized protein (DUF1778 family)
MRSEARLIDRGPRNTRQVVPIRLSGPEREQIAKAAARQGKTVSGFVRESALASSAVVTERVTPVRAPEREVAQPREAPFVLVKEERPRIVDGLRVLPDGRAVDWDNEDRASW